MKELNKIGELEKIYSSLQPLSLEKQQALDKKFRLEFNYNTNHLEGNTITYSEVELLLIFDEATGDHSFRELEEMKGSDVAFQLIQELALEKERPLTEQNIKQLNQILLVRPFWKDALTPDGQSTRRKIKVGDYKEHPNSVRLQNGEMFNYASPMDTPIKMAELIDWFRTEEEKKELSPVVLAALLHYKFVLIHPFDDGNGRISRLLMNYVLLRNNLPPVIIKTTDKKNYLSALNRADAGDIVHFIKYIAEQLIWSLELCIKAARGESIDEPGDLDKKIKLLKQKLNASDEAVKVTKSSKVILQLIEHSLEPLFLKLSTKLSELDILFKEKKEYFFITRFPYATSHNNFSEVKNLLMKEIDTIIDIVYNYELADLRKGTNPFNVNCSMSLEFHQNVYELKSSKANFYFDKLYNQVLTDNETAQIVEAFGTYIINEIEKQIGN